MDQFDRSPEDVSFDLDAEEYSLESILDEYKDFQTDAPAPRPQPAYRSRPVTAEMIEEEEAEDAEAEDILMSAELDSALKAADPEAAASAADTPPHEDHDVKRYQPKRQRDHATEEEVEKWNETKANAKRLAKKGISGLKHFASKLSEVVPDEPVEPEEEPPAEDTAIPVSPPPEIPEGLYDPEPEPEEPTRVFQAVTEEGMNDSAAGGTSYARAGDYAATKARTVPRTAAFRTRCSTRSWRGSPPWLTASGSITAPCTPRPMPRRISARSRTPKLPQNTTADRSNPCVSAAGRPCSCAFR